LLCGTEKVVKENFVDKARVYFDIETFNFDSMNRKQIEEAFLTKVKTEANSKVMGAALRDNNGFYVLRAKKGVMDYLVRQKIPEPLRKLDVTIVTKLVLQDILGLDSVALDDERRVLYTSRAGEALGAIYSGKCAMALILNPTRLDQMQEVSDAGLIMPRKSTYFYPKVMTGLVINKIDD